MSGKNNRLRLHYSLKLCRGNERTDEGYNADNKGKHGGENAERIRLLIGKEGQAAHKSRRSASEAVEQRHHLRHLDHFDFLGYPCADCSAEEH